MEQELDDGKFWLPAAFLDDEDVLTDFKSGKPSSRIPTVNKSIPNLSGFGLYGINSDSSSLGEPVTEAESDEEDYINELSRYLAQSTLEDEFCKTETNFSLENHHLKSTRVMAGSPRSTLWGCNQNSSRGSSNCPSPALVPVPVPEPPLSHKESPRDVLCAIAGEVARLKMTEEAGFNQHNGTRKLSSPNPQFHQIQPAQLKQQQLKKQQQQYRQFVQHNRVRNSAGGGNMKPVVPSLSAWPTLQQSLQQPPGSGTRAVAIGNFNTKRECTGTGVFLPQPHKKRDAEMGYRNSVLMTEQRRRQAEKELWLPQEWTY